MTVLLPTTRLGDFAVQALERPGPNDWLALVVPLTETNVTAEKLTKELAALEDNSQLNRTLSSVASFVGIVRKHPEGTLVLSGFDAFTAEDWQFIDRERSLLQRQGVTILVLGDEAIGQLFDHTPNFASWLGGAAWRLEQKAPTLSAEDRERRLDALRRWARWTDTEVITQAEQGQLPPDPPFSEWLVLLGRGDLLGK
ncbi:hypothetical protein G4177_34175 [Corallococcus sp. ZKHCc1 1396]|uniref:Uncharacterized protein n=1 Tax=Corallococcus soli TaxID=2710757 RepID=A0ABR9PZ75_9BACT|nr:hypothetical protein [Corallococcus soli]MBE4753210.1 hypothetical protein [Corallococcus soli]